MRKLASIQQIEKLTPIPGADNIELANVLGWHVVVKKDQFKIGDKCIYVEIDSILPYDNPNFEFLAQKNFRIKTIKLRGQISQGICFPISILPIEFQDCTIGTDVTEVLKIKKYDPEEVDEKLRSKVQGKESFWKRMFSKKIRKFLFINFPKFSLRFFGYAPIYREAFPEFIPKTDETRVQNLRNLLSEHKGELFDFSEKIDGTSTTIFCYNSKVGICSRNIQLDLSENEPRINLLKELDLIKNLKDYCHAHNLNLAMQGELIGPKIQGNKYNLSNYRIYFFGGYDIDKCVYLNREMLENLCNRFNLDIVPNLGEFYLFDDVDALVKMAEGKSLLNPSIEREGIVIRKVRNDYIKEPYVSFKAINPKFLLKFDE